MKTENLTIANLSCNGCVKTITKTLKSMVGVEDVNIDLETSLVSVNHNETVSRDDLKSMLLSIGYPEASEANGLLTHLKSVTSCLTGKFSI